MKKILSFILLTCFIPFLDFSVYADVDTPLVHVNLLDLEKLDYVNQSSYAQYRIPLTLNQNVSYTIVASKAFLGSLWESASSIEFEVESLDGTYYHAGPPDIDFINERAYFTFFSASGTILIHKIPVDNQLNYEIILYEGQYQEFPGFIPYLYDEEQLDYHGVLPIDFDQKPTLDTIKNYVIAKSPYGETISSHIAFDDYSLSQKLPGSYRIIFETSFNHIIKRYHLQLKVFDMTPPQLSIEDTLYIPLTEKWSLDTIKGYVTVVDNVDMMTSTDLSVISDTYSGATMVGLYEIRVKATDSSGNSSTLSIPVELIDTVGPVIEGPTSMYIYTTDTPLTNTQIQARFKFYDMVDGLNVNVMLTYNEYQQTQTPGKYMMTFRAIDLSDNVSYFNVFMHVIDNKGPVFETSELILVQSASSPLSDEDIVDWLSEQLSKLGHQATHIKLLYNEYESHRSKPGSYYVYVSYRIHDEDMTSRIRIDVEDKHTPTWIFVSAISGATMTIGLAVWFIMKRKTHNS